MPLSEQLLDIMTLPLLGSLFLGTMLGRVLKLQFANPQARLLPGYAAANLVVVAAIVGVAMAIEALLVPAWAGTAAQLVLLSLILLAIVASAWNAYLMSSIGLLLLMALTW